MQKEEIRMKRQLKGIALILTSLVFMLGFGGASFFDLSFRWSAVFAAISIAGLVMAFLPDQAGAPRAPDRDNAPRP